MLESFINYIEQIVNHSKPLCNYVESDLEHQIQMVQSKIQTIQDFTKVINNL